MAHSSVLCGLEIESQTLDVGCYPTGALLISVGLQEEGRCGPVTSTPTGPCEDRSLPLADPGYGSFMFSDDSNFSVSFLSIMSLVCTQCRPSVHLMNDCFVFLPPKKYSGLVLVS